MLGRRHTGGVMAAALLALALAACNVDVPAVFRGSPTAAQSVQQLGFRPLHTAGRLGFGWRDARAQHAVRRVELDPAGKAALLVFASPVVWEMPKSDPAAANTDTIVHDYVASRAVAPRVNAAWVDLTTSESHGFTLPGPLAAVDFAQRRVTLSQPGPDGSTQYVAFDPFQPQAALTPVPAPAIATVGSSSGMLTVPDSAGGGQWVFTPPLNTSSGTGRTDSAGHPGSVQLVTDPAATPLSVATGSLPFTGLAGDAKQQRAFLALDGAGVALADLTPEAKQPLRWLIRDSGSDQFFLQPASGQLVVANDEGLSAIGLSELADLAPRLGAAQALSSKQIKRLKPAAKAVGWDWTAVQFNPLGTAPGELNLLDSADPDSTTAELVWSAAHARALKLLITRQPRPVDEALRTADPAARAEQVRQLLAKLGWPNAAPEAAVPEPAPAPETPLRDAAPPALQSGTATATPEPAAPADDVQLAWTLDPAATGPRNPGRFTLWLTPDAAVWELRGATGELPADALLPEVARGQALDAALHVAGFTTNPQALPGGGVAGLYSGPAHFGWTAPGPTPPHPLNLEGTATDVPYYVFEILQTSSPPLLHTIWVEAHGRAAVYSSPEPASIGVLRRARQGEFGADAVKALASLTAAETARLAGQATSAGQPQP